MTSLMVTPTAQPAPPLREMTSAPLFCVRSKIFDWNEGVTPGNLSSGKPSTVADDQTGSMLSPCSPRIMARTWVAGSFSSAAMSEQKRELSSMVPRPMTCCQGRPSFSEASWVRMSTGLETTKIMAVFFNPACLRLSRMPLNSPTLRLMRSRRDSSGLRRSPAVMQTTSACAQSA